MALRQINCILLKNSNIVNRPLPSTLLGGEAIVNTADGIVFFSGVTSSTNEWTPAGVGIAANFWEVGSNLYDLRLRNRITEYEGISGAGLVGKFLSGTTSGFTLADISSIMGIDTYVTAFTYSNNVVTIYQNVGQPPLSILINTMTGLTVNGVLSASTANIDIGNVNTLNATAGTITTLGVTTANINTLNATGATITTLSSTNIVTTNLTATTETVTTVNATNINVSNLQASAGTITILNSTNINTNNLTATTATINTLSAITLTVSGTTNLNGISFYNQVVSGTNVNEIVNVGYLTSYTQTTDVYVTGATYTGPTNNTNNTTFSLLYHGTPLNGPYTISSTDTFITGTTWTPNLLRSFRNDGVIISTTIDTFSALTVTNLTPGRVVYVGAGGQLTDEAGFTYNDVTNTISTPTDGAMVVGTGGLTVGSGGSIGTAGTGDVTIHGNLTVFGQGISAFTAQLYVEDPNVIFNYNPTGSTIATSIGAGLTIQDGNGIATGNVEFDIRAMNTFTGLTADNVPDITEYTGPTGFENRAWVTQLNDIVIRSTSPTTPNGVRVLGEFDCLDSGSY